MTDIFALSPEDRSKIKILISRPQQAFAITKDTYFDMDTRYASLESVSKGSKKISVITLSSCMRLIYEVFFPVIR